MQLDIIGKFIARLRREKGLTQKRLGEILNVESKTISKWERGKYAPDVIMLIEISKIFNVSVEEIINGKRKEIQNEENNSLNQQKVNIKKIRIKYFIIYTIIILLITIFFSTIIINQKNEQLKIAHFNKTNSIRYDLNGVVLYNKKQSIYIFRDIVYNDDKIGTSKEIKIYNIKVSLLIDDDIIGTNYMEFDKPITLFNAIQYMQIYVEDKNNIYDSEKEIKIRIEYQDNKMDDHSEIIQIK